MKVVKIINEVVIMNRKDIIKILFFGIGIGIFTSCFNPDVFEKSDRNKATTIYVVNPNNPTSTIQGSVIWNEGTDDAPDLASISLPPGTDLENVTIQSIVVPSLASVDPDYKTVHNFTGVQKFWVIAENGTDKRRLDVQMTVGEYERQLKYGSLTDYWYEIGAFNDGNKYYNIGEAGQPTSWANTNVVAAILNKATCIPSAFPDPTGHVVLTTLYNKTAGSTVGSGIASANIFLGEFRANGANFLPRDKQRNNADQGINFIYKPRAVQIEYKYTPGTQVEEWVEGTGAVKWLSKDINETDSMEIWVALQNRTYDSKNPANTVFKRIGSGGFISSEKVIEWKTIEIKLYYGRSAIEGSVTSDPSSYRMAGINKPWSPLWVYHFYTDTETGENRPPIKDPNSAEKWIYTTQRITETWGSDNDPVTHLSMTLNASAGGWKYKGAGYDPTRNRLGSKLEIRNVELLY
jgi:hypothetical protein